MNLTKRLFLLGFLTFLPAVLVVVHLEYQLRQSREAEIVEIATRQTRQATSEIARLTEGLRALMTAVAATPAVRRAAPDCADYLAAVSDGVELVAAMALVGPDGAIRCSDGEVALNQRLAGANVVAEARSLGHFAVGRFLKTGAGTAEGVLPAALPVGGGGPDANVIVIAVDLRVLNRIANEWGLGPGSALTIADRDGVIVARNPFPDRFVGTRIPDAFQAWVKGDRMGVDRAMSQDGTARMIAYKPAALAPQGLYISTGLAEAEAFADINEARQRGGLIIAGGMVLALFLAYVAGRVFVRRPVDQLLSLAEAWRGGPPASRPETDKTGEFGEIAAALDRMGRGLAEREEAARQSEGRLRRSILAAPYPLMLHADDGSILELSESWLRFSGYTREDLADTSVWYRRAFPDAKPLADAAPGTDGAPGSGADPVLSPFASDRVVTGEERSIVGADGRERIWEFSIVPLERLADGRQLRITAAVDVTERKRAAEAQALLMRELDHRVKNTLATVQAIAAQTARTTPDPAEFERKFSDRLHALARTHDMLTRGNWRGLSLRSLLEAELAHVPAPERVGIDGPDAWLPPETSVSVSLVAHELVTNAIKYGALSGEEGELSVRWTEQPQPEGGCVIDLEWVERGGPPVTRPERRGFGSRLIEQLTRSLGEGETTYPAEGLRYRLKLVVHAAKPVLA
jgi:two-component sensor histidine kinase/PAS domain-containing protein